jgi:hypothetical protein
VAGDPTRLAPIEGIVRIGSGRDASDIAFLTSNAKFEKNNEGTARQSKPEDLSGTYFAPAD